MGVYVLFFWSALQGNHLAMGGIVGAINRVLQNNSPLPHPSTATSTSLPLSNSLSNRYELALVVLPLSNKPDSFRIYFNVWGLSWGSVFQGHDNIL